MSIHLRRRAHGDDGIAMLTVVAISFVIFMFVTAMFTTVLDDQMKTRFQQNITTAQAAAEAGVNEWVYLLNQMDTATNTPYWDELPTQCTQATYTTAPQCSGTIGKGSWTGYFQSYVPTDASKLVITMQGRFPAGTGDTRTLRVVVQRDSPPAFNFSLFASKGIDIHHHGSAWLSPQVVTPGIHSNGYINLDYSSEYTVSTIEAVTTLTFQKGGGSDPGGAIPTGGYNWYDTLNGKCYPGNYPSNPAPYTPTPAGACSASYKYSGNATISGNVSAGTVVMGNRGNVMAVPSGTVTELGVPITAPGSSSPPAGDILAGKATLNGTTYAPATTTTYTGPSGSPPCNQCGAGATANNGTGGYIAHNLTVQPGYAPPVIPFPNLDYSTTYEKWATDSGPGHVFTTSSDFLNWITDPQYGYYRSVDNTGHLQAWTPGTAPNVILLQGDYVITNDSLNLDWGTMMSMVNSATSTSGPAPILIIQGSLVVETGNISLQTGIVVTGRNQNYDFLRWSGTPGAPNSWPNIVDTSMTTTGLLDPNATEPGIIAAGGSINSSDYDTDSTWTDVNKYEPMKATPIYIRGLVYGGKWDATNKVSIPQSMHWHNYDPKNVIKIYGAQVGAQLHDCNNFAFTYDPLVRLARGFGGGSNGKVKIVDYQELGR